MKIKRIKTGDLMQVSECKENEVIYGSIAIKLKSRYAKMNEAEAVLIAFMRQLQPTFSILHTTGVEIISQGFHKTIVVDYWQDKKQQDWKVKGWTDGRTIAVLYIKNIHLISVSQEAYFFNAAFLNGR